jgi:hypothetical protein
MQRKTIFDTEEFFMEEMSDIDTDDPVALLQELMHDCPECQAARAHGETPITEQGVHAKTSELIVRNSDSALVALVGLEPTLERF